MTNLIVISGTSFCGKTILAQKISNYFNIKLLSQNNTKSIENIVNFVNTTNLENIIVEHNNIFDVINNFKNVNLIIYTLNVKKSLLKKHYKNKLKFNLTTKEEKSNIKHQTNILQTAKHYNAKIIEIKSNNDYSLALNSIIYDLKNSLHLKKQIKNKQTLYSNQFKNNYFAFYDDVKSNTHQVYDW